MSYHSSSDSPRGSECQRGSEYKRKFAAIDREESVESASQVIYSMRRIPEIHFVRAEGAGITPAGQSITCQSIPSMDQPVTETLITRHQRNSKKKRGHSSSSTTDRSEACHQSGGHQSGGESCSSESEMLLSGFAISGGSLVLESVTRSRKKAMMESRLALMEMDTSPTTITSSSMKFTQQSENDDVVEQTTYETTTTNCPVTGITQNCTTESSVTQNRRRMTRKEPLNTHNGKSKGKTTGPQSADPESDCEYPAEPKSNNEPKSQDIRKLGEKYGYQRKETNKGNNNPTSTARRGRKDSKDTAQLTDMEKQIEAQILDQTQAVTWNDIVGLEEAKRSLMEMVILPNLNPAIFQGLRSPPKGLLLFGPPGNGKTYLAKAVASQANATFFNISASALASKWFGDGEKLVEALFSLARKRAPSVIFFDEVDSLLSARGGSGEHAASRRIKTEFLCQLDGCNNGCNKSVTVLAATNRPMDLDEAVLRRLTKRIFVPLPDQDARMHILTNLLAVKEEADEAGYKGEADDVSSSCISSGESTIMTRSTHNTSPRSNRNAATSNTPTSTTATSNSGSTSTATRPRGMNEQKNKKATLSEMNVRDFGEVVALTEGYSASDLTALSREAALEALREIPLETLKNLKPADLRGVKLIDFKAALKRIRKSVGEKGIQELKAWSEEFGV